MIKALPSIETGTSPKPWTEKPPVEQFIRDYKLPDAAFRLLIGRTEEETEARMADMVECLQAVVTAIQEAGWPLMGDASRGRVNA